MSLTLPPSMNDRQDTYESDDELQVPRSPNLMVTSPTLFMEQESQTSLKISEPYHPPAEKGKGNHCQSFQKRKLSMS